MFCADNTTDLLAAELYDPTTDLWTPIAAPPTWMHIGDGPSCMLPDGRLLLGCADTNSVPTAIAIWDPGSGSWCVGGNSLDDDSETRPPWDQAILVA